MNSLIKEPPGMRVSVIIPTLNEEKTIAATLAALRPLKIDELLIVDGSSTDRTIETCNWLGVNVLSSTPRRSAQMNLGARHATGDVLLFLHADTRLPSSALNDIRAAMDDSRCPGGRFDVKLDGDHWMLQVIGAMISLRSRFTKISTGDQAIFVRRDVFDTIGGYPDIPLMEDIAFSRALPDGQCRLSSQPRHRLCAALGNGRGMEDDFEDVDAQVALPLGGLALPAQAILCRRPITLWSF